MRTLFYVAEVTSIGVLADLTRVFFRTGHTDCLAIGIGLLQLVGSGRNFKKFPFEVDPLKIVIFFIIFLDFKAKYLISGQNEGRSIAVSIVEEARNYRVPSFVKTE